MTHDDSIDPQFRARLRSELVRGVRADARRSSNPRHRRAGVIVASGAAVLAFGAFAVFGFQAVTTVPEAPSAAEPAAGNLVVLCVDEMSISDGKQVLGGVETDVQSNGDSVGRMLAACSELWEDGTLSMQGGPQSVRPQLQTTESHPILNLCTLPDGAYVVAPFTCEELDTVLDGAVAP